MKKHEKRLQTQIPRRFPGFAVVVVTFFVKILDDFHDFVSECVTFRKKIKNPFWRVNILPTKIDEQFVAEVSPSNSNYSSRIINN